MNGGTRWVPAMRRALARAQDAAAHGDVPIGAVLLGPDGEVLAEAGNERELTGDPSAHAEVLALRRAVESTARTDRRWSFEDATLVVTLEPCAMCAGALVNARVGRLVYGALDAKAGAVASVFDIVRDPRLNHRVEVVGGVLADEAAELLRSFFSAQRGQPIGFTGARHDKLTDGGVSERPKERASKARDGSPIRGFKSHRHRQHEGP